MARDDARTIVCFGDSNTWGASPVDGSRLPRSVRWTGVLRAALGDGVEVIEEGLNARTTVFESPLNEGRVGKSVLQPILWSHAPVDLVIVSLGTNDLKSAYRLTAPDIANGAATLVDLARRSLAGPGGMPPKVLLVAPPPLGETTTRSEYWGFGAARAESQRVGGLYRTAARIKGVAFLDAGTIITTSPLDGVHFDAPAHALLGAAIADLVRAILD